VEEGEQAAEARTKEGGATEEEPPERRCRGGRERERLALGGGAKREQWREKGKRGRKRWPHQIRLERGFKRAK